MAEQQPAANPAPTGGTATPPPAPGTAPAGDQAANTISFESFSDDAKKYLAGQGVTSQETLTADAINKLVNHAQTSQKTAAEKQAELDKIKNGGVATPPPAPTDGTTPPVNPSSTTSTDTTAASTAAAQAPQVDSVQMYLLANTLVTNFPELKDSLQDGSFYKNMNELGIPTLVNGSINLAGIQNYGRQAQSLAQANARIEELSKPGSIPNGAATLPAQPDANTPMSKQLAQAIALYDPSNPRNAEAKKFLADNA